jgi:molecular chaperone DnaJ
VTDYYEILGVPRDASPEQIKKAYRKLARELHPDVAGNVGEDRFKDVARAYEVLSNPDKRQQYDMGVDPTAPGGGAGGGFGAGFGFQDIFETFFGGGQPAGPVPRARRGNDALVRLDLELAEAVFGAKREIQVDTAVVCNTCAGDGARPGTSARTCDVCHGRGSVQRVARSFLGQVMTNQPCSACGGFGTVIPEPCTDCAGEGRVRSRRTVSVNVPAGVDTGTRIKLSAQGEVGPGGGPAGDLYVEIRERAHDTFVRRGDELHCPRARHPGRAPGDRPAPGHAARPGHDPQGPRRGAPALARARRPQRAHRGPGAHGPGRGADGAPAAARGPARRGAARVAPRVRARRRVLAAARQAQRALTAHP